MSGGAPWRVCLKGFIGEYVWRGCLDSMSRGVFLESIFEGVPGRVSLEELIVEYV